MRPLTLPQRKQRRLQVGLAVFTLLLVALEVITHPWFHHEM
jgi:hypothetical protein